MTILGEHRVWRLWRILCKNPCRSVRYCLVEEPNKRKKVIRQEDGKITYMGSSNPKRERDIIDSQRYHDVITHAYFGVDWFRGSGVTRGRILCFSIGFAFSCHYNTSICEGVIHVEIFVTTFFYFFRVFHLDVIVYTYVNHFAVWGTVGDDVTN